jgi:hypothetical protein
MTSTFTTNSGFKTFGVFKESQSTTDYTLNKKAKTTFCKANVCVPNKSVGSQGQLDLLRKANNLEYYDCDDSFDKTNLNVNLITKLDLTDVCVIQNKETPPECPTSLGPQTRFDVSGVTIDPYGSLFGNDVCGINNFTRYMVYNPPPSPNPPPPPDTCGWSNPFGNGINNDSGTGFIPIVHGKDGDIFVGGLFTQVGNIPANSIACWNSVTEIWSNPFGLDLSGVVYSLAYDDINDILYVAGEFDISGNTINNIAKWSYTSGWAPLGNGQLYQCLSIVLDNSNNILYAASIDDIGNSYLQKWVQGGPWANVDQVLYPDGRFQTLALDGVKNLYVGGAFVDISGNTMNNIAKWSITTNVWSSLGSGLTGLQEICSCIFYNSTDNSLYVGGVWNNAGGIDVKGIAKWDLVSSDWSIIGSGLKDAFVVATTSICVTSNGYISVASIFINIIDGSPVYETQVATFDGTNWSYSCACNNFTSSILPDTDNSIYVTGQFTLAGNITATRIAKLNLGVLLSFSRESMKIDVDRKTRRRNRYLNDE